MPFKGFDKEKKDQENCGGKKQVIKRLTSI